MFRQDQSIKTIIFDDNVEYYSQGKLAQWAMDRKNIYGDINVVVRTNESEFNFDTLGCNSEQEIINKNQDVFNKMGLPNFIANSVADKTYITIDGMDKSYTIDFEKCDSLGDFVSLNQNVINEIPEKYLGGIINFAKEKINNKNVKEPEVPLENNNPEDTIYLDKEAGTIEEILAKMMEEKSKSNKEVVYNHEDMNFSTKDCSSLDDIITKYQKELFADIENERAKNFNNSECQLLIRNFTNKVGSIQLTEEEKQIVQQEYSNILNKKVDFEKPQEVRSWLDETSKYINNINFNSYVDVDALINILNNNGYTSTKKEVNGLESYQAGIISYDVADLEKYHFFAGNYLENYVNSVNNELENNNQVDLYSQIELYSQVEDTDLYNELGTLNTKKKRLINEIKYLEQYALGSFDSNRNITPTFNERIKKIQSQISVLEEEKSKYNGVLIATDLSNSKVILNHLVEKESATLVEATNDAIQLFKVADGIPSTENIIKLLEKIEQIPDTNKKIKEALLTSTIYLNERYSVNKEQEEKEQISEHINKFDFKTDKQKLDEYVSKLNSLNSEYQKVEQEKKQAEEKVSEKIKNKKEKLFEVISKIDSIEEKIALKESKANQNEGKNNTEKLGQTNQANEETKQVKNNERIFTDEERIDKDHSYLSADNAKNMNLLNDFNKDKDANNVGNKNTVNNSNNASNANTVNSDNNINGINIPTPKDDKFKRPHPIKAIKTAGSKLKEKISNFNFKEKMKKALEWFYKHKVATFVLGAVTLAAAVAIGNSKTDSTFNSNVSSRVESDSKEDNNEINIKPAASLINQGYVDEILNNMNPDNINYNDVNSSDSNSNTVSDDKQFEDAISNLNNDILAGTAKVYTQENNAFDGSNYIQQDNLYAPSWQNAEVGAFYANENGNITQISREEAETRYNNGEDVVAKMENDGVGIGFINLDKDNQENIGMSK